MHIITGAAGFIGSNISIELDRLGYDLVLCDILDHEMKIKNISSLKKPLIIKPSQLINFIKKNSKKIESVIHMGAISSTAETNLELLINNNLIYSENLFSICNKYEIKLIYASSAATYGNGENGFDDKNTLLNFIRLNPINLYGLSKHLFDLKVLESIGIGNMDSRPVGLKFFNVYGPNEMHKGFMMSPVPKFLKQIKETKKLNLFKSHNLKIKDGKQARDFIYVKDCVDIILWLIKNDSIIGIINVGTGIKKTFLELAKIIFKNQKIKENIKFIPTPKEIRKGYQYMTRANISLIRKKGYKKNFTSLKDGVNDYINNYL